jgi:hypothetical protein
MRGKHNRLVVITAQEQLYAHTFVILGNFGSLATEVCTFLISVTDKFTCDTKCAYF